MSLNIPVEIERKGSMEERGHGSKHHSKSFEMLERTPYEQDVLHRYYQKIGHTKATHGVLHHGDVLHSFTPDEQKIIHSFLHEIGQKAYHARVLKKELKDLESLFGIDYELHILNQYYQQMTTSSHSSSFTKTI
ncbi:unnamed protein product [Brachionus calyciflorus]|uniref:Uncharacterized protein n=1 Tax=Brachionus calyciflorus TaxID=104777 RepID=A0A814DI33_9BILA|nr:unnamed protein product [Brachionus calyciflorus]